MGDGADRAGDCPWAGIRESLWRVDWADCLGAAAISVFDWRRVQGFRNLFKCIGDCSSVNQQLVYGADVYSDFLRGEKSFRREGGAVVGMGMGAAALRDVLVAALDMGHDVCAAAAEPGFSGCLETRDLEWLERMDLVWDFVGSDRALESVDAVFSAVLWIMGLVSAVEKENAIVRWGGGGIVGVFRRDLAMDCAKSCGLRKVYVRPK